MRRLVLPLLLIVAAVACVAGAYALEKDAAAESAAAAPIDTTATPVLSPRRLPFWLLQPAGDDRLRLGVQPVIDQSPPDTCLVVTQGRRSIVDQQADLAVVPASNTKIVTGWAALHVLGADATYRTTVVAGGEPVDGVVDGDVWLVGGGDPVLTTGDFVAGYADETAATRLEDLADAIAATGVTTITGGVVGDDTRYDDEYTVPGWPSRDYGTETPGPLDALLVNRGLEGYRTDPETVVVPSATSDPSTAATQRLIDLLDERGVTVQGSAARGPAPEGATELAGIDSPPVREIVMTMLRESDNTVAELLVKELSVHEHPDQPGSTSAGLEVLRNSVEDLGLSTDGLVFEDGSGLHGADRLTCGFLAGLLDHEGPDSVVALGLPVSGQSGTLRDRLGGPAAGRIRAKTGSLDESAALSGFADSLPGSTLTFAYVANAADVPDEVLDLEELLASVLIAYPEGPTPAEVGPLGG